MLNSIIKTSKFGDKFVMSAVEEVKQVVLPASLRRISARTLEKNKKKKVGVPEGEPFRKWIKELLKVS